MRYRQLLSVHSSASSHRINTHSWHARSLGRCNAVSALPKENKGATPQGVAACIMDGGSQISPGQGTFLHDGEIFQLELDDLNLPLSQHATGPACDSLEHTPAIREESLLHMKNTEPSMSQPVPLPGKGSSQPAAFVLTRFNTHPQDGWGNLLGRSR